jgi:hypothetical protein
VPSPSQSSRFYHPHNIGWGVQLIKLLEHMPNFTIITIIMTVILHNSCLKT